MAMVLDAFASYLQGMLTEMAAEEIHLLLGVSVEIDKMGDKLKDLKNFLADADRRNITDESVQEWVTELKRAMYDATDILDLCQLKAMESGATTLDAGCCNPLLFCTRNSFHAHDIGSRIKKLNERLDAIKQRGNTFSLINLGSYEDRGRYMHASRHGNTTDWSGVVGEKIEEDTRALVAEILQKREGVNKNIMVVAIVGVGGIGKTTLAQKVFNDEAIQSAFNTKIWLSVNQVFNNAELLRKAIILAGGNRGELKIKSVLQPILTSALIGKKFLLVMDDLWSLEAWEGVLKIPLVNAAAPGSRVLVTTRNEAIARGLKATWLHHIDRLSLDDAWSLLKKQILLSETDEYQVNTLKDIGVKIIQKCGGLPLAVKIMGGLLCQREMQRRDWEQVLDDSKWSITEMPQELNHAVYLSYEDMPPYLKQCFLYYSLLPKSNSFHDHHVIGMWISEGFIHGNSGNLEELGRNYYKELISRNLIEVDELQYGQKYCSMHDVVRSFGQYMAKTEALVTHNGEILEIVNSRKFFRLSIETDEVQLGDFDWKFLQEQSALRTLISNVEIEMEPGDSLVTCSSLRTLYLKSADLALIESLHQLKHLRYLHLKNAGMYALPDNIGKMNFLQYLDLLKCSNLVNLPGSIVKLVQLRYLNLPDELSMIPRGFRCLTNMRILGGFPALMDGDWCSLDELGPLSNLIFLRLEQLENVSTASSAANAILGEKVHLINLLLGCTSKLGYDGLVDKEEGVSAEDQQQIEKVFNDLCPPRSVEYINIKGYFGQQLPSWMMSTAMVPLNNLKFLLLSDLACCNQLPNGLCQLPCLQELQVHRAPCINRVGAEFLCPFQSGSAAPFPRLNKIELEGMVEWEEWEWEEQVQAMPCLEELRLQRCKLRRIPAGLTSHAKALRRLLITSARYLSYLENFASVVVLDVCFSPELERVSNLPLLQKLTVVLCPKLKVVKDVPALQKLVLEDYGMETLPEYMGDITPRHLEIECSIGLLTSITEGKSGNEWEKFSHLQHVKAYAHDGDNRRKWYVFYTREPFSIDTNVDISSMPAVASSKDELNFVGKDEDGLLGTHYSTASSKYEIELVGKDEDELVDTHNYMAPRKDEPEPIGKDEDELVGAHNSSSKDDLKFVGQGEDELLGDHNSIVSWKDELELARRDEDEISGAHNSTSSGDEVKLVGKDEDELVGVHHSMASSEDESRLVGIDGPREHLIKMLDLDDDTQLKMVSICGTGGLGKTTIAKAVYRKIGDQFTCQAFVPVPRKPDIKEIIRSICEQVCRDNEESDFTQQGNALSKFLEDKRYLIIFDGIWDVSAWDQVLNELGGSNNNHGSRIIITTRKVNVAEHVGCLYHLPLLSYNDSKMLFYRRTLFGSEDHCPSQFRELCKRMLSKCGQLPLAIIVIAKLLPRSMELEEWQNACSSIGRGQGMENIRRVLKHSYDDLDLDVKTCLLYLSILPEGHEIRRDVLVRRWIAENLIREEHGHNLQELGESYFSELVNSSLIEPIEFDNFGKDLAYRVHVTTLDLIVSLSIEKDSVTILAGLQQIHLQDKKIQRLSLQVSNEQHDVRKATKTVAHNVRKATKNVGQVSSLSVFCGVDLIQVSKFKGLHVLDLEKCDSLEDVHLNGLKKLYELRYLALGSSHITVVPPKISKLKHLQTLDLTATGITQLRSSIAKLTQLRRLLINRSTEVPAKIIGKLQALEELVEIDISKSPSILEDISTMPELRVLSIALWSWDESCSRLLSEALCKLSTQKLKRLSISTCCSLDLMTDVKSVLQHLEKLEIQGSTFNRIPNWIGKEAAVSNLRSLSIEVYSLENDALRILGKLSHLLFLSLAAKRAPEEKLVVGRDGYSYLQTFLLFNRAVAIKFEEGAMKKLQRLKLTLQASLKEDFCFGLENLFSLKRVQVEIICFSATDQVVKEAEAAMQTMIGKNPYKPTLEITKTVKKYMIEEKIGEAQCEMNEKDEDQEAGDARPKNRVLQQRRRAEEQGRRRRGSIEDDLIYLT